MIHDGKILHPALHLGQRTVRKRHDRPATQAHQMMVMFHPAGQPILPRLIGKIQRLHDTQLFQQRYRAINGVRADMRAFPLHLCQNILGRQPSFGMAKEHVYDESAWACELVACFLELPCDLLSAYQRSFPFYLPCVL